MKRDKIYTERLLDFAFHLDNAEMTAPWVDKPLIISFGSRMAELQLPWGLIIELPVVFPEDFGWDKNNHPAPKHSSLHLVEFTRLFFGLNVTEFLHLFALGLQSPDKCGGRRITENSFPQDVGDNIFELLRRQGLFIPTKGNSTRD